MARAAVRKENSHGKLGGYGSPLHLAGRFFESLVPVGPSRDKQAWALGHLTEKEGQLFSAMGGPDRRHAVGVAERAIQAAEAGRGTGLPDGFVAAALLHDVGKLEAHLGVLGRVAATVLALVSGRRSIASWAHEGGMKGRMGRYVTHDQIGATALERAGSDPLVVSWAREHHLPEARWSVDPLLGRLLKDADGD